MKHTRPDQFMTWELLSYVRDNNPTISEFQSQFGSGQRYHVLRKSGVIVIESERVRLNRRHLSPDGKFFTWGNRVIWLDRDEVWHVCYAPGSPVPFSNEP